MIDATHDAALTSWVASANKPDTDFPIQNLPYGKFRRAGSGEPWRIGVAIGDQVLDLKAALAASPWVPQLNALMRPLAEGDLNALIAQGAPTRRLVRAALSSALREGSGHRALLEPCLVPQSQVELTLPVSIGDYTDFYTSIHHATTVGKLFRPDNPLLPNYKWVPIGYHGRGSSIGVSGQEFRRPWGQLKGEGDEPQFVPCKRLDYELELGAVIGGPCNALGEPMTMDAADDALAGLVLLNDWSARDVQAWEYQPLGPFLSKNFASTISPWLITMEALEPYRTAFERAPGEPAPLPYLDSPRNREAGAFDITLEVWLQTAAMRARGQSAVRLTRGNFRHAYWTLAQMVAHHASNGCNLNPGDLLGTGTQSGPNADEAGSLLELTLGGKRPISLPGGETRTFLEDGDLVTLRASCEREGYRRIGFGDCAGRISEALSRAAG